MRCSPLRQKLLCCGYLYTKNCYAVGIPAKGVNVVMHPVQGGRLVPHAKIGRRVAQHAQPILRGHHHQFAHPHQDHRVNLSIMTTLLMTTFKVGVVVCDYYLS